MPSKHEKDQVVKELHKYNDMDVAADRVTNFSRVMAEAVRSGSAPIEKQSLAHTDVIFMLDTLLSYTKDQAINAVSSEKKTHLRRLKSKVLFLEKVKQHGGIFSSADAARILGVTKVTVKAKKDQQKLLALNIDGEFFYPVFQFSDEVDISDKGILKGIAELLPLLDKFSDRLQYSFFMEPRTSILDGVSQKEFTVAEILRQGPSDVVMDELFRLARLYGSQDAA